MVVVDLDLMVVVDLDLVVVVDPDWPGMLQRSSAFALGPAVFGGDLPGVICRCSVFDLDLGLAILGDD